MGRATGIVSTARITHATPAAAFAHSAQRDWEADSDLSAAAKSEGCIDIARQLVEGQVGSRLDLVLGGGRDPTRSEEHTSELQSLMRISYAVFCLKKKKKNKSILIM